MSLQLLRPPRLGTLAACFASFLCNTFAHGSGLVVDQGMLPFSDQAQVLGIVVVLDPVHVMDGFVWREEATERLLHDQSVLGDISLDVCAGVFGLQDENVASVSDAPALPEMMLVSSLNTCVSRDEGHGVAFEVSTLPVGVLCDGVGLASTSTLTQSRGDLLGSRLIASPEARWASFLVPHAHLVARDEASSSTVLVAPSGGDGFLTSTFAEFFVGHVNLLEAVYHKPCEIASMSLPS